MKIYLLTLLTLLALVGCKSETDNKPAAVVEASDKKSEIKPPETKPTDPAASTLNLVAEKSVVAFVGGKVTADEGGDFKSVKGHATATETGLESLEITVDTTSLSTEKPKLTQHLSSPDFFDVEKFPTAKFVSKSVKAKADAGSTHTISGDLTIRGISKSISFPATITASEGGFVAKSEFTIQRGDFGIVYKGMADNLIKEDVLMKLNLVFAK